MPIQYDDQPGLDLSSLGSATLAQVQQAISQIAPLSNIGGVICFDGVALGAAGTGFPDVTSNPRFVRYLWLDTNPGGTSVPDRSNPVFKRYVGAYTGGPSNPSALSNTYADWVAQGVADGAITTAMLRLRDATGGVNVALLKRAADGTADAAFQYQVLRIDAAGQYIEAVTLDNAIANAGGVNLNRLSTSGLAVGKYLGYSAGILAYRYINPSTDLVNFGGGNDSRIVAGTSIAPGAAKSILRTNSGASNPEWIASNNADLFQSGDITLPKLAAGGAVANDYLKHDGTNWVKQTPAQDIAGGMQSYYPGTFLSNATKFIETGALASCPKYQRAVIVCTTADAPFAVGDEVDACGVSYTTGVYQSPALGLTWIAATSKLRLSFEQLTNFHAIYPDGTAELTLTPGRWAPKIYYWI